MERTRNARQTFRLLIVAQTVLWAVGCGVWFFLQTSAYLAHPTDGDLYAHTWAFQAFGFSVSRLPFAVLALGVLLLVERWALTLVLRKRDARTSVEGVDKQDPEAIARLLLQASALGSGWLSSEALGAAPVMNSNQHPAASLALSALAGWLALIVVFAGEIFLLPHGPHFAPEVGPMGAFIIFGGVFSFFYVLDFLLIAVPCFLFLRGRVRPGPLLRCICGAALFCLSVPLWSFASGSSSGSDILLCSVLAAVAGAASFLALRRSNFSASAT